MVGLKEFTEHHNDELYYCLVLPSFALAADPEQAVKLAQEVPVFSFGCKTFGYWRVVFSDWIFRSSNMAKEEVDLAVGRPYLPEVSQHREVTFIKPEEQQRFEWMCATRAEFYESENGRTDTGWSYHTSTPPRKPPV